MLNVRIQADFDTMPTTTLAQDSRNEQLLLDACRKGDAVAWENLVRQYERLVISIPLRLGLNRNEADDIFQLTFSYLLQNLNVIREASRLVPWLATVARRQSWLYIHRARREMPVLNEMEDQHLSADAAVLGKSDIDRIDRAEMTMWLDQGLSRLDKRCRDLLAALYFETDQPIYADIAAHFGMPVGSVGPTRARCLERLKQFLSEGTA
jgi:RNA polymerase sigma factor (sigma-70 family)